MRKIRLINGGFALVDNADFKTIKKHRWYSHKLGNTTYATCKIGKKFNSMGRIILGITNPKILIDHRNRNGLDNQRKNLRESTKSQNATNSINRIGTSSKYRGISFDKVNNKWKSCIRINGKQITLGRFNSQIKAAREYDKFAIKHHGDFCTLNFKIK